MNFKINFPNDPIAALIVVCGLIVLFILAFFLTLFIVLPLVVLTVCGILYYRHLSLEKMKAPDKLPQTVKDRHDFMTPDDFRDYITSANILHEFEEPTELYSCEPLVDTFNRVMVSLYSDESFYKPPLRPQGVADKITIGAYYDDLERWQRKVSDKANLGIWIQTVVAAYLSLRDFFPRYALHFEPNSPSSKLTTNLQLSDDRKAGEAVVSAFYDADLKMRHICEGMRQQIDENDSHARQVAFSTHLARTPFRSFLQTQIPITIPFETRAAGMWVCAPQGQGKTTLLHTLVEQSLETSASVILMDTKGELIEPFLYHQPSGRRRIIIGPDDPIGINPLDIPRSDINKAVDNLEYLFASLLDFKLTATQSMLLKGVFRALIETVDSPTLEDFQLLLGRDGEKRYAENIARLSPDLRNLFAPDSYNGVNLRERRQEVLQRLRSLLENDILRPMLMAPKTTFRISEAMDSGALIIINASRGRLGNRGAEFLGRFFIMQVLSAAQERSFKPEHEKRPVFFYADEVHTVVKNDERITDVLHECRSQKIALTVAHQEMSQVSEKVLSAFRNCAVRFANPDEEARAFSSIVRLEARTLQTLKRGQFGAYIRGLSKEGLIVNVEKTNFPDFDADQPRLIPTKPRGLSAPPIETPPLDDPAAVLTPTAPKPTSEVPSPAPAPKPEPLEPKKPATDNLDSDSGTPWEDV